jgi:hypothetical protein
VVKGSKQLSIRLYFMPLLSVFRFRFLFLPVSPVFFIWLFLPFALLPLSRDTRADIDAHLDLQLSNKSPKPIT